MKRIASLLAALLSVGGLGAWIAHNQRVREATVRAASRPLPTTVAVQPVLRQRVTDQDEYLGQSTFWREVPVTAPTPGLVRTLTMRLNNPVRAGQPLLTVDSEVNRAALTAADAALTKARRDLLRYETLHRDNNAPATEVETARLQVANAELQVVTLRRQIRESVVKAPIGGIVTEKPIEAGQYVTPGAPLATITDVAAVKVIIHVPETELAHWPTGRSVPVRFEAYPGVVFSGTVHDVSLKSADFAPTSTATSAGSTPVAGRFAVAIRVRNHWPDRSRPQRELGQPPLRIGMMARVVCSQVRPAWFLTIPRTALVPDEATPVVYVLRGQRLHRRPVEVGETIGTNRIVRRGLRAGEPVVVSGSNGLRDGMIVSSQPHSATGERASSAQ